MKRTIKTLYWACFKEQKARQRQGRITVSLLLKCAYYLYNLSACTGQTTLNGSPPPWNNEVKVEADLEGRGAHGGCMADLILRT